MSSTPILTYAYRHGHCLWELNIVDGIEKRRSDSELLGGYLLVSPDGRQVACVQNEGLCIVGRYQSRHVPLPSDKPSRLPGAMSWSPDGTSIAFCRSGRIYLVASASSDGTPELVSVITAKAPAVTWSPDGTRVAYSSCEEGVFVAGVDGEHDHVMSGHSVEDLAWSPAGDVIAFSTPEGDGGIWCVDITTGRQQQLTDDLDDEDPVWSPCGEVVAYTRWPPGEIRTVKHDGTDDSLLRKDKASDMAWSPDGSCLAYTLHSRYHHEATARIIDSTTGDVQRFIGVGSQPVWMDDHHLVWLRWMGESIGTVDLEGNRTDLYTHRGTPAVRAPDGKRISHVDLTDPIHSKLITSDDLGANPRILAVGETSDPTWLGNGDMVGWISPTGAHTSSPDGTRHHHFPNADLTRKGCCYSEVEFSPDGQRIAYSTDDGLIIAENSDKITTLPSPSSPHATIVWSPDGQRIAYPTDDGLIIAENSDKITTLPSPSSPHATIVWSPDGQRIAYPTDDGLIIAENSDKITTLPSPSSPHATIVWSPDGQRIAHASSSGIATIDVRGRDRRVQHYEHEADSGYLVWSPTGARLMWYSPFDDQEPLAIADIVANRTVNMMVGYVDEAVWSPDGSLIAFVSDDGLVVVTALSGQQQRIMTCQSVSSVQWR